MDVITAWRHLFSAVIKLGSGAGTVEERLRDAYRGDLLRVSLPSGLPERLRDDYALLMKDIATLFEGQQTVDTKRASGLAKRVVAIYDRVTKELQ